LRAQAHAAGVSKALDNAIADRITHDGEHDWCLCSCGRQGMDRLRARTNDHVQVALLRKFIIESAQRKPWARNRVSPFDLRAKRGSGRNSRHGRTPANVNWHQPPRSGSLVKISILGSRISRNFCNFLISSTNCGGTILPAVHSAPPPPRHGPEARKLARSGEYSSWRSVERALLSRTCLTQVPYVFANAWTRSELDRLCRPAQLYRKESA
jgi:hypothetical protein